VTDDPALVARQQYGASTQNLDRRVALHRFGTNAEPWADFVARHSPLRSGERVLDVGAGTGLHWSAGTAAIPVLVDLHQPMLEALRPLGHSMIRATAEQLPFTDRAFDGVLCTHVLYHVTDPCAAVGEIQRVVKEGGWIVLASNGPRHMSTLDGLRRRVGLTVTRAHADRFGIDDCAAGLAHLQPTTHLYEDELRVTDARAVVDYCRTLDELSPEQASSMESIVGADIARLGFFRVTKEVGLVTARRRSPDPHRSRARSG
jgi:ubiquinone/menaquinone biosynthesis C-methylase UbiE